MIERVCKFCGKLFIPRSNRQIYCDNEHIRQCPRCGKFYVERCHDNLSKPAKFCSRHCMNREFPNDVKVLYSNEKYVIVDSKLTRDKYDNLSISNKFESEGKICIHYFPDDNIERLIQMTEIKHELDANECSVYKLNTDVTSEFLLENDIVPYYRPTILSLGLVKENQLYQVITFCIPKYTKKYDYEIKRVCTRTGYDVKGGLDKLSTSASVCFDIHSCITYVDKSKNFCPRMFESIGMNLHHSNAPKKRSSGIFDCGTEVYVFN